MSGKWKTNAITVLAAALTLGVAQASNDGPALPATPASASQFEARDAVSDFGTGVNILQIPASAFTSRNTSATFDYLSVGYIYQTGGFSDSAWAPIYLPSGAGIQFLDLYAYDTNATNNITATIRMWTGYGTIAFGPAVPPTFSDLVSVTSAGSAGHQYVYSNSIFPLHTVNNDVAYGGGAQYTVVMSLPVQDTSLGWKAVDIWWYRQIAPAPGAASFTDVPTTAQFFREVEALAASGITTGCTATTFCPDQAVTRRQMAAFLSRALGLGYGN